MQTQSVLATPLILDCWRVASGICSLTDEIATANEHARSPVNEQHKPFTDEK